MKRPFTIYRIIRIDGQFDDTKKENVDDAISTVIAKTVSDINAYNHTIEDGVEVTAITDCGESV